MKLLNSFTSVFVIEKFFTGLSMLHHIFCFRCIEFDCTSCRICFLFIQCVTYCWFKIVWRCWWIRVVIGCSSWISYVEKWFIMSWWWYCLAIKIKSKNKKRQKKTKKISWNQLFFAKTSINHAGESIGVWSNSFIICSRYAHSKQC